MPRGMYNLTAMVLDMHATLTGVSHLPGPANWAEGVIVWAGAMLAWSVVFCHAAACYTVVELAFSPYTLRFLTSFCETNLNPICQFIKLACMHAVPMMHRWASMLHGAGIRQSVVGQCHNVI